MSDETEKTDPGASVPPPPPAARPAPPPPAPARSRRGARLILGISVMGLVTLIAATAGTVMLVKGRLGGDAGSIVSDAFLEVDLTEGLSDAPSEGGFFVDPADFPPLLTEVTDGIRRAATDPEVKGLYLEVGGFDGGWAAADELRDAVSAFRASDKPCYVWSEGMSNKDYFIASACKDVYLAPAGIMLVNGFEVTTEYYVGVLEKVGVQADFEHVGDFKTAVEPLQRSGPSEAAGVAMNEMLDSLYEQFIAGVAAGRGLEPDAVRALVDDPPITPSAALERGMVDGLKYRDEVRETLAGEERTSIKAYRKQGGGFGFGKKRIAVVHADGQIVGGESGAPLFGGKVVGDRSFAEILEDVRDDDSVVAVVLRVNSPGGSGLASDNMWREIARTRESGRPVVVSMGDYAASGGYYISAGADRIVAEPGTLTGSIGVFGGKLNTAGLFEKVGVTMYTWKRGELAGLLSGTSSFSDAERAKFREFLEGFYKEFVDRVAEGRGMTFEEVHAVAQGRVWTGQQALDRKLVDELGGLDVAIARARELAKLGADDHVEIERLPRQRTFIEQLTEDLQSARVPAEVAVVPGLAESLSQLEMLDLVLADGGVAALLPMRLDVK